MGIEHSYPFGLRGNGLVGNTPVIEDEIAGPGPLTEPAAAVLPPPNRYLRLKWGGTDIYVIDGPTSLQRYSFYHDTPTPVLAEDANGLLALTTITTYCCGQNFSLITGPTPILEEV